MSVNYQLGFSIFFALGSHHWVCSTVGRQGGKWRERKGKDIKEGEVKTKQKAKQNGEGVNISKNKNAYGGYSKYYLSSVLIIVGMGILFCHRKVTQIEKGGWIEIDNFWILLSLNSQVINLREPVHLIFLQII